MTRTALVSIGANLGEPAAQVASAMTALGVLGCVAADTRHSSLWVSRPVGCPPGAPDFVNAVTALTVPGEMDPLELFEALMQLEIRAGRVRRGRNTPRPLDLDLLLCGELCRTSARLTLPHPRGHERAFVLLPAAEVAPELHWPGQNRCIQELAALAPGRTWVRRLEA